MSTESRKALRHRRLTELIAEFQRHLDVYTERTPFTRSGQLESHRETVERRRAHVTVGAALEDDAFLDSLYRTLRAWGIGVRASRLADREAFGHELRSWTVQLANLDGVTLAFANATHLEAVWRLINGIDIVDNEARLVALTKTLHHLLPDLVMPIDRAYTGVFFAWHVPEFQTRQREIFDSAWVGAQQVAKQIPLNEYVESAPWNTSATKVIDNAIVGYCIGSDLVQIRRKAMHAAPQTGVARRESWDLTDLEEDLVEFANELQRAGLKPHTIGTYVGRAETFLRWLAGRYEPRGPNT